MSLDKILATQFEQINDPRLLEVLQQQIDAGFFHQSQGRKAINDLADQLIEHILQEEADAD